MKQTLEKANTGETDTGESKYRRNGHRRKQVQEKRTLEKASTGETDTENPALEEKSSQKRITEVAYEMVYT